MADDKYRNDEADDIQSGNEVTTQGHSDVTTQGHSDVTTEGHLENGVTANSTDSHRRIVFENCASSKESDVTEETTTVEVVEKGSLDIASQGVIHTNLEECPKIDGFVNRDDEPSLPIPLCEESGALDTNGVEISLELDSKDMILEDPGSNHPQDAAVSIPDEEDKDMVNQQFNRHDTLPSSSDELVLSQSTEESGSTTGNNEDTINTGLTVSGVVGASEGPEDKTLDPSFDTNDVDGSSSSEVGVISPPNDVIISSRDVISPSSDVDSPSRDIISPAKDYTTSSYVEDPLAMTIKSRRVSPRFVNYHTILTHIENYVLNDWQNLSRKLYSFAKFVYSIL